MEIFFYKMIDKTDKVIDWFNNVPLKKKLMVLLAGLVVLGIIINI